MKTLKYVAVLYVSLFVPVVTVLAVTDTQEVAQTTASLGIPTPTNDSPYIGGTNYQHLSYQPPNADFLGTTMVNGRMTNQYRLRTDVPFPEGAPSYIPVRNRERGNNMVKAMTKKPTMQKVDLTMWGTTNLVTGEREPRLILKGVYVEGASEYFMGLTIDKINEVEK
jgi:hypothetical protein